MKTYYICDSASNTSQEVVPMKKSFYMSVFLWEPSRIKSNPTEFYQKPFGYSTQVSSKMSQCKAFARHKSWKLNFQKKIWYSTEEQLQETFWDLDWEATKHGLQVKCNGKQHINGERGGMHVHPNRGHLKEPGVCFPSVKSFTKVVLNHCKLASCPSFWMDVDNIVRLQKVTIEMIHMLYNLPCGKTLKEIKRFDLSEERRKNKRWMWLNYSCISTMHLRGFSSIKENKKN